MHNYQYIDLHLSDTKQNSAINLANSLCIVNSDLEVLKQHAQDFLHPLELNYFVSLKYPKRQTDFLRGRYAAKLALQRLQPNLELSSIGIENGVFGFPYLNPPLAILNQISISHCSISACALAFVESHPMAVDMEQISLDRVETIKTQMVNEELELALTTNIDLAMVLTMFWTAKEALSKAIKSGLWIDFKLLEIKSLELVGENYVCKFKNFPQYQAITLPNLNSVCTIVFPINYVFIPDAAKSV